MGSYTLELREIIEQVTQFEEMSHTERIKKGHSNLFDFDYPIFDEAYRNVFETHFIRNFYMREIGFETEGLFKFRLETWLNINMPYYNKLFESELIEFDPLESYNLKTKYQKVNDIMQDGEKRYSQNDKKTINQNDKKSLNSTENEKRKLNDITDKTQQDSEMISKQDNRDLTVDNFTNSTQHGSSDSNMDATSNVKGNVNEMNDKTDKSTLDGRTEIFTIDNEKTKNFNRNLTSDTPDSRLAITTDNGKGVIEYASKIAEDVDDNLRIIEGKNTTKTDDVKDDVSKENRNQDSTSDTTSNTQTIESTTLDEDVSFQSDVRENQIGSSDKSYNMSAQDRLDSTSSTDKTTNDTESFTSDVTDDFTTSHEDKTNSKINDIEDYIESKVGSIGVKTYSEMIKEYRNILLRIERDIFYEMNELFMLVY